MVGFGAKMNSGTQMYPKTLYEKLYEQHVAHQNNNGTVLLYIDRHLIHEVSSPQAFAGLDAHERSVRCPQLTLATCDHNVPTTTRPRIVKASQAKLQVETLTRNVQKHQIPYLGLNAKSQGIVHVIGPELGFTLPGTTVVCGDSHTSTHGAFGCLAFGIGTSEVEHVLATQTILTKKWKSIRVWVDGELANGVGAKDLMLHIIGVLGTASGTGAAMEFAGPTIEALDMEARMTICNMAIEAGARAGLVAPDSTTFEYIENRPLAPHGQDWDDAVDYWANLKSDEGAVFSSEFRIDATEVAPIVSWGTSPEQVVAITGRVPTPDSFGNHDKAESCRRALAYMGLHPGTLMKDIAIDRVFIGSCTNSRLSDLRAAASVVRGRKIAQSVKSAYVVPGSGLVKMQAEKEGLDRIFKAAGFQWREPGCSMCVGLNEDQLGAHERSASTSNRNFENRQGFAGRTHLVSPAMAAAAAVEGKFCDVRQYLQTDAGTSSLRESASPPVTIEYGDESQSSTTSRGEAEDAGDDDMFLGPFTSVSGFIAPLDRANVDTDCILPKQFCTTILRRGLRDALFYHLRWSEQGQKDTEFVLNRSPYDSSSFICAGANFGCGSSREHAVWALVDFGIRAIFAPSFGDIFYGNCFKNGLLPGIMSETGLIALKREADAGRQVEVVLKTQQVLNESCISIATFEVDIDLKEMLMTGVDEIGMTLQSSEAIAMYEKSRGEQLPWLNCAIIHEWEAGNSSIRKDKQRNFELRMRKDSLIW